MPNLTPLKYRKLYQIYPAKACIDETGQACNGTNIVISPGLYMDFSSSKSPGAWWATSPVHDNGIEDLSVENTDGADSRGITLINCFNCWIKGVRTVKTKKAHPGASQTGGIKENLLRPFQRKKLSANE